MKTIRTRLNLRKYDVRCGFQRKAARHSDLIAAGVPI